MSQPTESGGGWTVSGYRHLRLLGEGASGRVVLAVHEQSGRQVAVKYLAQRLLADHRFLERFRAEAQLLAGLRDPHLVRFFDYVESQHGAAIVMEFVAGPSLRAVMNSRGALQPEVALLLLKGSLLGLESAHRAGVVHRDYKPENILVPRDGTSKLADFGVAVPVGQNATLGGTPAYMAPEQWAAGTVSPATDVYAATVVFFECLAASKPYQGTTLAEWATAHQQAPVPVMEVPEKLRGLVAHGMAKDPATRPASAAAFVEELESTARAAYGRRWEKRARRALGGLVVGLLTLLPKQLVDQVPAGGAQLGKAGLAKGGLFAKPAFLLCTGGIAAAVLAGALVLHPWKDSSKSSDPGSSATSGDHGTRGSTADPDSDDDPVRKRMKKYATANFTYEMRGCCGNEIWAKGNLDRGAKDSSVNLSQLYDGADGSFKSGSNEFVFRQPGVGALAKMTRAYAVGAQSYVNVNQGWQSHTPSSAKYRRGDDPESVPSRYKTAARDAFNARGAASARHVAALLESSGKKAEKAGTYRGTTTTAAVIGRYGGAAQVYGELTGNKLTYTLNLDEKLLPTRLEVKVATPGGNSSSWLYRVTYSGWGDGDRIEPPSVPKTSAATRGPATAATSRAPKSATPKKRIKIYESPNGRRSTKTLR